MKPVQKRVVIPDSEQVRVEATQTLVERLGIAKAALFIRDNLAQKTDYTAIKKQLFDKLSAVEVFERMKQM
jgi:hypothetical protein